MSRTSYSLLCASIVFGPALAWADEHRAVTNLPLTSTAVLTGKQADARPRGSAANRWRYSFHNGHWWYYRDGGRWAYWNGHEWRDFEPKRYRQWYAQREADAMSARMARFDERTMAPYLSHTFLEGLDGGPMALRRGGIYPVAPSLPSSGGALEVFTPRPYDGRLNPATSVGGYMGGALRGPFGY